MERLKEFTFQWSDAWGCTWHGYDSKVRKSGKVIDFRSMEQILLWIFRIA